MDETNEMQETEAGYGEGLPDEREDLRREVEALRAELARREAEADERALFDELYPDMRREEIPRCVLEEAEARKIPLAAAVAMHERRCARERELALLANETNRGRSTGGVGQSRGVTQSFTLEEIRAMTPAQVKRNYRQIVASLGKL